MTCIAWDGKTLAADKLCCFGVTKGTVTKIQRFGNYLCGVTGNLSLGMEMLEWFKADALPKDYPSANRDPDKGSGLVVVKPDRTVWKYESTPYPFKIEGAFCAFGSGDESAMIAMECGCDARRAVEVAIKYNTTCGNGVDTLTL
jgi:hypothetical protein